MLEVARFLWRPRPSPLRNVTVDAQTANFYEHYAADLALRYESAASPVERFFPLSFAPASRVLDVGAGSGRDLAALLRAGCDGYGVEPSSGPRHAAVTAHPQLTERLIEGSLPGLGTLFGGGFEGIVCCAVLMHLPDAELFDAALALHRLLKVYGRPLLSVPTARADVGPDHRDTSWKPRCRMVSRCCTVPRGGWGGRKVP
jgi:SAM-dependent methyltransferase